MFVHDALGELVRTTPPLSNPQAGSLPVTARVHYEVMRSGVPTYFTVRATSATGGLATYQLRGSDWQALDTITSEGGNYPLAIGSTQSETIVLYWSQPDVTVRSPVFPMAPRPLWLSVSAK